MRHINRKHMEKRAQAETRSHIDKALRSLRRISLLSAERGKGTFRIFRAASPEKSDIEEYVRQLIEAAEKREGGLAHLRFELRRKLPLKLYS